jgi:hypothetical protein
MGNNAGIMSIAPLALLKFDLNIKGVLYRIVAALPHVGSWIKKSATVASSSIFIVFVQNSAPAATAA